MGSWNRRIAIVANRGPNDFAWQDGRWVVRPAAGGLVSMLEPLARRPHVRWFCCVAEPPDAEEAREGLYTTAAEQTARELLASQTAFCESRGLGYDQNCQQLAEQAHEFCFNAAQH